MIKASELMVGNWLYSELTKCEFQATAQDILNISIDNFVVSPIPLTPEILEKAGFVPEQNFEVYRKIFPDAEHLYDSSYMIFSGNRRRGEKSFMDDLASSFHFGGQLFFSPCKYLHQLQNIYFALTGEELNIKF